MPRAYGLAPVLLPDDLKHTALARHHITPTRRGNRWWHRPDSRKIPQGTYPGLFGRVGPRATAKILEARTVTPSRRRRLRRETTTTSSAANKTASIATRQATSLERIGVRWRTFQLPGNSTRLAFGTSSTGRWMIGNDFIFPDRPHELPPMQTLHGKYVQPAPAGAWCLGMAVKKVQAGTIEKVLTTGVRRTAREAPFPTASTRIIAVRPIHSRPQR